MIIFHNRREAKAITMIKLSETKTIQIAKPGEKRIKSLKVQVKPSETFAGASEFLPLRASKLCVLLRFKPAKLSPQPVQD